MLLAYMQEQLRDETSVREQREKQLGETKEALAAEQQASAAAAQASTASLEVLCFVLYTALLPLALSVGF